jgi:hypothetical protein
VVCAREVPKFSNWGAASQSKPNDGSFSGRASAAHGCLKAYGQSNDRPMLHHIIFVSVEAGAFFKVQAQGPVPQQARVGDAIGASEGEVGGAKHIS